MKNKVKIYIASPLGFTESGRLFLNNEIIPIFESLDYGVLDPWQLTKNFNAPRIKLSFGVRGLKKLKQNNQVIGNINENAIKEATGLLAILDGVDIDSGVASEIGYASALNKTVLGYRSDFRLSGDNQASIVNLQSDFDEKFGDDETSDD